MELLIVVAVIGILIAIAVPSFRNAQKSSNENADIQAVSALYTEMQADYELSEKTGTKTVDERMRESFNSSNSRAGELNGLELNGGWTKGAIVSITSEKDGDTVKYTAEYR